eukprot:COSAG04_NODE_1386_length_6965_cov_16.330032_2_plen_232_part_00
MQRPSPLATPPPPPAQPRAHRQPHHLTAHANGAVAVAAHLLPRPQQGAAAASSPLLAADIERERERIERQTANRDKGMIEEDYAELGLPFPVLPVGRDGAIPPAELEQLEARRAAAAARHEYREAALMHDLLQSLGPDAPAPRLSDCLALQTADERAAFFLEFGFCVVQTHEGAALAQLQAAWHAAAAPHHRRWRTELARDGARLVGGSRADLFYVSLQPTRCFPPLFGTH